MTNILTQKLESEMKILSAKIFSLFAAFVLLTLMVSSCEKKEEAAKEPYKIGAVFAVTGGASFLGDPEKKTAEMIVEQINAKGGVNGHPLELIVMDTETNPTKATLAVKKLMTQENVLAVVGPSASGITFAVMPLAEKHQTPLVSCAASYKIVHNSDTGKPYPWVFKTPQSDTMAVEANYTYLKSKGWTKIAIMSVTSGFGASGRSELIRLAPEYGMEIVADEKYGPKDTDMTVQLTKIKSLNPQAIINWSVGPVQVTVVRNWKDLGMQSIKFFQSHGFGSPKNIELAAGAAEGVYLPAGSVLTPNLLSSDHVQHEITNNYLKTYNEKYNEPLSTFGGHAWDSISLVAKALETAGNDKAKIRDALENIQGFVGQHGVFNFSADDHNGLDKSAFNMLVVKNGTWAFAD